MRVQKRQICQMLVKGVTVPALVMEVGKSKTVIYNFATGRLNTVPSHKPKARKAKPVATIAVTPIAPAVTPLETLLEQIL